MIPMSIAWLVLCFDTFPCCDAVMFLCGSDERVSTFPRTPGKIPTSFGKVPLVARALCKVRLFVVRSWDLLL